MFIIRAAAVVFVLSQQSASTVKLFH
jgi:hypothetical protein